MIQRSTRDYEVSLWSLQDSLIAILKQYGLEHKGQIQNGKLTDKDDGTQTFSFQIPMYYIKNGEKIQNPSWYNVINGSLLVNMRKIKVIFNKDAQNIADRKIYEFLIVKVNEQHNAQNQLYCNVECEGLAFHELGKIGYKISLSSQDFYNDDYDWATNGHWYNVKIKDYDINQPLATLNYWNDKVFDTVNNWTYQINMNWNSYSLCREETVGVLQDYTISNDIITQMKRREPNKVYEEDFIDSWKINNISNQLQPSHMTYAREKARISVDIQDSNIYNITQSLAETFGVFCRYEYQHDENCHIIGRKVIYYNNFLQEQNGVMDITYPYQTSAIKREIDSTDLVTKLYVKSIQNSNGILNIMDVGANKSQEDYILNFDYLYNIGAITEQQYNAIDKYILNIRKLNQNIARVSSKVISLQSQLTKIEAQYTTRKNSIALDTQQLLSNTALLNAITNGEEVISISSSNPQTAVLLKDTGETRTDSYYVKITQKGVYPESIHLFKKYSYNNSQLDDEINTGVVVFDDAGEVIKVSNIYLNYDDPKTVYMTYKYRPKLYYQRIVAMWQDRLNDDTIRAGKLYQEIAQLNYSLYGEDSKYSMKGINLKNLTDYNVYNKYMNLLDEKNSLIKDFNAMMGPALREGYWQPEDYTDYGDQYNDKFQIQLNNLEPFFGTTGNSYFKWDNELFEGQQDLYYEYSAAQYKQAYPCIDLSTQEGAKILRMLSQHPDLPISFVFTPVTANEEDINSSDEPIIRRYNDQNIILIPNLYTWENNTGHNIQFSTTYEKLPQELKDYVNNNSDTEHDNRLFKGLLQYQIAQGWRYGDTTFSWQISDDGSKWDNIINLRYDDSIPKKHQIIYSTNLIINNQRLLTNNDTISDGISPNLQLLSTNTNTLNNKQFRLVVANTRYGENEIKPVTKIRYPGTNTIILPQGVQRQQHRLKTNSNAYFQAKYNIINGQNDYQLNYYTWTITNVPNQPNNKIIISYRNTTNQSYTYDLGDNKTINCRIIVTNNEHKLRIINSGYGFSQMTDNPFNISLNVKTFIDYAFDTEGVTTKEKEIYQFYRADTAAPYILVSESNQSSRLSVIYNGDNDEQHTKFKLALKVKMLNCEDNTNLAVLWQIQNNNQEWISLQSYLNNIPSITLTQTPLISNINSFQNENILQLQINDAFMAIPLLKNKQIRAQFKNIVGWSSQYTFDPLSLIIPITNAAWADSTINYIVLNQNTQIAKFVCTAINATSCTWWLTSNTITAFQKTIIPGQQNISQSGYEGRYKFSCSFDNSTKQLTSILQIQVPTKNNENNLRDNNLAIYCSFMNDSNIQDPVEISEWQYLKINYPIAVDNTTEIYDWWPIQSKEQQIILLKLIIPNIALKENVRQGNLLLDNNLFIQLELNKIYQINNQQNYYEFTSSDQNKFQFNFNNLSYNSENECYSCNGYLSCLDLAIFKINSNSIIDTTSQDLDAKYKIQGTINITIPDNNSISNNQIKQDYPFQIIIRQCKPIIENAPQNFIKIFSGENPQPTRNDVDMYKYTEYPYQINNIELPQHPIIISYNGGENSLFDVNLNSIAQETVWACRSNYSTTSANGRVTKHFYSWAPPVTNQITIDELYSTGQAQINGNNVVVGFTVTNIGLLNSSANYAAMGYNQNLYVKISNPWGIITSKAIQFY